MMLTSIRESACIKANQLLNQANSKKGYKFIVNEINKMSEIFGVEFEKHVYKSIMEEIDFKEIKSPVNSAKNPKMQVFIQEFPNLLERKDFPNFFSLILNNVKTSCSATEVFDCLTKLCKINFDGHLKLLIAFNLSIAENFKDSRNLLVNKCKEIEKEPNLNFDQIQLLLSFVKTEFLNSTEEDKEQNYEQYARITNILNSALNKKRSHVFFNCCNNDQDFNSNSNSNQHVNNHMINNASFTQSPHGILEEVSCLFENEDKSIPIEKAFCDLGPMIINGNISLTKSDILDFDLDEKRLATFILFLQRHQHWVEDKENRYINKIFLKLLENDLSMTIEDNSDKKLNVSWNIDNYFKLAKPYIENLDYSKLFRYFDDHTFVIKDKKTLESLLSIFSKLKIPNSTNLLFDLIFNHKWVNEKNQLEILQFFLNNANINEIFPIRNMCRKIIKPKSLDLSVKLNSFNNHLVDLWSSVELSSILLKISQGNLYLKVKEMFEWPCENIPELLLLVLVEIKFSSADFLHVELLKQTFPLNTGNPNTIVLLEEIWKNAGTGNNIERKSSRDSPITSNKSANGKEILLKLFSNTYNQSPQESLLLSKLIDIAQKISLLPCIVNSSHDYKFSIPMALLAVKRDFLNLDQWLNEQIQKNSEGFIESLINYIRDHILIKFNDGDNKQSNLTYFNLDFNNQNEGNSGNFLHNNNTQVNNTNPSSSHKENILETSQLTLESLAIIFSHLSMDKLGKTINKRLQNEISSTYKSIFEIYEDLQFHSQSPNSEEVEEKTNKMFNDLFTGDITLDLLIENLKQYKNSQSYFETEVFAYMVYSLLQEYRFFPKYPENELKIMASLIGQLINHRLLDGIIESIALKYILNSAKKSGKMNLFATKAIEQFLDKIYLFPTFLESLYKMNLKGGVLDRVNEKYIEYNSINPSKGKDLSHSMPNQNSGNFMMQNKSFQNFQDQRNMAFIKSQTNYGYDQTYFTTETNQPPTSNMNPHIPNIANMSKKPFIPIQNVPIPNPMTNMAINNMVNPMMLQDNYSMPSYASPEDESAEKESFKGSNANEIDQAKANRTKLTKEANSNLVQAQKINEILHTENNPTAPPEIVDKINWIINSMSKSNISEKSNELKPLLNNETILKWFSNFFVSKRVSIEINYHPGYSDLINFIDSKELNNLLIKDTVNHIQKVLFSEKLNNSSSASWEKSLLKSLGSWLGIMTLAKNRPILTRDLDLKEILFSAYETGKLSIMTPFVCKILESSAKTKVFHPKNPYILALLSVLAEIYNKSNIKQNIKFEIEGLFKKLEVDLTTMPHTKYLDSYVICKESNDVRNDVSKSQSSHYGETRYIDLYPQISSQEESIKDLLAQLNSHANTNISKNDFLHMVTVSLQNSVNEILSSVADRAINISFATTKELIFKDFAFEPDEVKFKTAASSCINSLAGSLAMVTCKEPLRTTFINNLKENFTKKNLDVEIYSETINTITTSSEILEIGCIYIQNFVIKKALEKVEKDQTVQEEIDKRKKNKRLDVKPDILAKIKMLPEVLNPEKNLSSISSNLQKVYAEFNRIIENTNRSNDTEKKQFNVGDKEALIRSIIPAIREVFDKNNSNMKILMRNLEICLINIQTLNANFHQQSKYYEIDRNIAMLSQTVNTSNQLKSLEVNDISILANITFKHIVQAAVNHQITLLNIYTEILKGLISYHPSMKRDFTVRVMNNADEILVRFNVDLHYFMIQKELFDINEWETFFDYFLYDPAQVSLAKKLIYQLIDKNAFVDTNERFTLKKFNNIIFDNSKNQDYLDLFYMKNLDASDANPVKSLIDHKTINFKEEWVNELKNYVKFQFGEYILCYYKNPDEIRNLVKKIYDGKNEEFLLPCIMILSDLASSTFSNKIDDPKNYVYPDFLARFILKQITYLPFSNKFKLLEIALFGLSKIMTLDYIKHSKDFNQRPYYRILINLILILNSLPLNDELFTDSSSKSPLKDKKLELAAISRKFQFFSVIVDFLKMIKPQIIPGFSIAWIDLIGNTAFIKNFLEKDLQLMESDANEQKRIMIPKYEKYLGLLQELIGFIKPFGNELIKDYNFKLLLDTITKLLFLLSNSYPDFISAYYYPILSVFPLSQADGFLQMKNIILSAGSLIDSEDFFRENFDIETCSEINQEAVLLFDYSAKLKDAQIIQLVEDLLCSNPKSSMEDLISKISKKENLQWASLKKWSKEKSKKRNIESFFVSLLNESDPDLRNHLINALLNEIRYINFTTYTFAHLFIKLLQNCNNEPLEEHLLRNLLLRFMFKPYPSGLVWILKEIFKLEDYDLLNRNVVKNNSYFCQIMDEMYFFVQEGSIKNLENYI